MAKQYFYALILKNMSQENQTGERNLLGVFAARAAVLIEFRGAFVTEKEDEQHEADLAWNDFVESYKALLTEFREYLREAIIESSEYGELPDGKFLRKPTVLDDDTLY